MGYIILLGYYTYDRQTTLQPLFPILSSFPPPFPFLSNLDPSCSSFFFCLGIYHRRHLSITWLAKLMANVYICMVIWCRRQGKMPESLHRPHPIKPPRLFFPINLHANYLANAASGVYGDAISGIALECAFVSSIFYAAPMPATPTSQQSSLSPPPSTKSTPCRFSAKPYRTRILNQVY